MVNYDLKIDKCESLSLCIDSNDTKYGGDGAYVCNKLYMVDGMVNVEISPYSGAIYEVK